MAIQLAKGQGIDLRKGNGVPEEVIIGLGWKIQASGEGSVSAVADFDLDAIAFLLDENDRVRDRGDARLEGGDIVFFNSRRHSSGAVLHTGDNRKGGNGVDDDEQIVVHPGRLPSFCMRVLFLVCIYQGQKRGQHLAQVECAYIRAVGHDGTELARHSLNAEPSHAGCCSLVFGELHRRGPGWTFRAIGEAHPYDSFVHILKQHL